MKKILITILAVFAFLMANTQPTLTLESQLPIIGEFFISTELSENFDSLIVDLGNSGPDQLWDFSQYQSGDTTFFTYEALETVPCADSLRDATFALKATRGFNSLFYAYYKVEENTISQIGTISGCGTDAEFLTIISPPEEYYEFPASFEDNYDLLSSSTTFLNGEEFGFTVSEVNISYDAYGDIITPHGYFEDVLRVVTTILIDATISRTEVRWIQAGTFWPVCTYLNVFDENDELVVESMTAYDFSPQTPNSVSKLKNTNFGVSLLQNPVNQELRLQGVEQVPLTAEWMIINPVGQHQLVKPSPNIEVTNAAKGLNYLVIRTADAQQVIPFLVL